MEHFKLLDETLKSLTKRSKVFKMKEKFPCPVCKGFGHIPQECGTKINLDKRSKMYDQYERLVWRHLKRKLYYNDWLKDLKEEQKAEPEDHFDTKMKDSD